MSERKEFDYLIVGAGSAGCVLAARLSQDPTVGEALLEAAGQDDAPEIGMRSPFLSYSRPSTTREKSRFYCRVLDGLLPCESD